MNLSSHWKRETKRSHETRQWRLSGVHASLIGFFLTACTEPNAPPAPMAATASEVPASPGSYESTAADTDVEPALHELSAKMVNTHLEIETLCNLERINGTVLDSRMAYSVVAAGVLTVTGWLGRSIDHSAPEQADLWIQGITSARVWQVAITTGLPRADVMKATGFPALALSGFSLTVNVSGLPPGAYRLLLVYMRNGVNHVCDNGRKLNIAIE